MIKIIKLLILPAIIITTFAGMVSSANADETKTITNVTIIKKDPSRHIVEAKTLNDDEIILHTVMPNQDSLLKEKESYLITYDNSNDIMQIKKIHNVSQKRSTINALILIMIYTIIIVLGVTIIRNASLFSQNR